MSVKHAGVAHDIVELVGGPANVADVYHCQTRLRFTLKDESQARTDQLSALDGVAQAFSSGGVYQVVVGTHVRSVFEEVEKELRAAGVQVGTEGTAETEAKRHVLLRVVDFISSTFTPIIPALAGAGMVSALLAVLVTFGWVSTDSQTYVVISFIANACFYFLPIFLAFSAAGKLGINRIMAAVVAAMLVHPVWSGLVTAAEPVTLFNVIPLTLATYSSTVIPILIIVFVQSYVERFLERVIPESIKIVVVPMLVFFSMGILALSVLGPLGALMGGYLADGFLWLSANAPWAPPLIIGTLFPLMVMFGVHTAVGPIGLLQLGQMGYDAIFGPGCLCSNIAQGTAAAVVAIRTKEAKFRQVATAGAITAFMGITEPALYGVNLPKRYPLIAAMVGGGAGGLFAGITGTRRFAVGSSGLPAIPMYLGDDTVRYFVQILIALAISIVTTAVVAALLSLRFERSGTVPADAAIDAGLELEPSATAGPAAGAERGATRTSSLTAPVAGRVVPLAGVPDPAFSSGALGSGLAIEPTDGRVLAPCSGVVVTAMDAGHAFGIRTDDDLEVLVHVGIDTVQMQGAGFRPAVRQGDRVTVGQLLVEADLDAIAAAGHPATTVLVVTRVAAGAAVEPIPATDVIAGEPVITLRNEMATR